MAMLGTLAPRARSATLLTLTILLGAAPGHPEVRAWEDEVVIPTYPLGPEDSYPVFAAFGRRNIYPYAMQTGLAHEKRDVTHRVLMLENEHLRLMVLPDLGGRLYSLYDKDARRDVFYRNHVIKPGLVGQRGAWISGGVEFNFPTGHTVTGFSPVLGLVRRNEDGSASIVIGDIEKVTRMAWSVTLTLNPGMAALQQDVHLYNRTTEPHRYYFWSNSAFPARPQTRFISPARYQTDHGGDYVFAWPVHDGVDISWDRSHSGSTSYFGLDVREDFFGAYDYAADAGLVHVADHREVPGKKFWTWGTGDSSQRWVEILTDDDGQYIEVQSGRFWNQNTWKQLLPQQTVHWREWWYGVSGLGGFDYAEEDGALSIRLEAGRLQLGIRPVRDFSQGQVLVEREGRELARHGVKLAAARPAHVSLPVADTTGVAIRVLSGNREVMVYDPSDLANPQPVSVGERGQEREPDLAELTPDAILLRARHHLNRADFEAAEEALAAGLEIDPGHVGLLTTLGFTELTRGLCGRAESRFAAALERDDEDPGALYGGAVAAFYRGDLAEAEKRLRGLFDDPVYGTGARLLTGQALMRSGRRRQAAEVFSACALRAPHADKAAAYHAAALRSLGRPLEALAAAAAGLAANPLSSLLQTEAWLCRQQLPETPGSGNTGLSGPWQHRDPDVLLEAVVDELAIGDHAAARAILHRALLAPATGGGASPDRRDGAAAPTDLSSVPADAHPLVLYYLADAEARLGNDEVAVALGVLASRADTRDVFPFRVETVTVLDAALERDPQDAAARYYRGNVLARHGRLDEALAAWQRSVALDRGNPVAWRNVALALADAGDEAGAVEACRQAIAAAPADIRLYSDLDELYRDMDADLDVRLANITEGLRHGRDNDLATAAASLLTEAGRYQEAIDLLSSQQFDVWEGGYGIHSAWEAAHMGRGLEAFETGATDVALHHFLRAMEYPANLGVGRPENERLALPKYWAGRAHEVLGQQDEAAVFYRQAAEEEYRRASPTQYYQGLAFRALGQADDAERVFRDMIEAAQRRRSRGRRGGSSYASLLAGLGHHGLGETDRARELLQTVLDDPESSTGRRARYVRRYLGTVREIMGE